MLAADQNMGILKGSEYTYKHMELKCSQLFLFKLFVIFATFELLLIPRVRAESRMNVLFVTVDTLRADHLGCYGYRRPTSPHVDSLAAKSVRFTRAFTQGGWTKPAMASVMLSLYPFNHRVFSGTTKLPADIPTLAQVLNSFGWKTLGIQTNPFLQKGQGFGAGYDSYLFEADATADRVVDLFLQNVPKASPWFAYLHFMDPHLPYKSPQGTFINKSYSGLFSTSDNLNHRFIRRQVSTLSTADKQFLIDRYDEEIAFFDQHFGRIANWLSQNERWKDTIVAVIADHGEEFFEHGGFEHGHSLYNEILHVPFILYVPTFSPAVNMELVRTLDLYPTILGSLKLSIPPHALGIDLSAAIRGEASFPKLTAFSSGMRIGAKREALQDEDYKIINTEAGSPRFFNLSSDPGEKENLALASPPPREFATYQEHIKKIKQKGVKKQALPAGPDPHEHETIQALESLGYL